MQSNGPIKILPFPRHNVGDFEPRPATARRLNIERFCRGQFGPSALKRFDLRLKPRRQMHPLQRRPLQQVQVKGAQSH